MTTKSGIAKFIEIAGGSMSPSQMAYAKECLAEEQAQKQEAPASSEVVVLENITIEPDGCVFIEDSPFISVDNAGKKGDLIFRPHTGGKV